MKNNKGFSFVELLGTIVILGILSGTAIAAITKYIEKSRQKDYDALATSAYNATESYIMKNGEIEEISLEELNESDLLSNILDPADNNKNCSGKVYISNTNSYESKLSANSYIVELCCTNYKYKYKFTSEDFDGEKITYTKEPTNDCGKETNICEINATDDSGKTVTPKNGWYSSNVNFTLKNAEKYKEYGLTFNSDYTNIQPTLKISENKTGKGVKIYAYTKDQRKKTCHTKWIKVDKTYPTVKVEIFKADDKKNATGKSLYTYNVDDSNRNSLDNKINDWFNNANFPNGIVFKITATDNESLIESVSYQYNGTNATDFVEIDTKKEETIDENINKKTYTRTYSPMKKDGYRTVRFIVKDTAGNTQTIKIKLKIDKTSPIVDFVANKRKADGGNGEIVQEAKSISTSTISYKNYKDLVNDWMNNKNYQYGVNFIISNIRDLSGISSTTWNGNNNTKGSYTTDGNYVGKNAASYRIVDNAGNETKITVEARLDRTVNNCAINKSCTVGENDWCQSDIKLSSGSTDSLSGIDNENLSKSLITKDTTGENVSATITDKAGNIAKCSATFKKDTVKPSFYFTAYNRNSTGGNSSIVYSKTKFNYDTTISSSSYTGNVNNGWLNAINYPYGINFEVSNASDSTSGIASIKWGKTSSKTGSFTADGYNSNYFKITDNAGNTTTITVKGNLDRERPTVIPQDSKYSSDVLYTGANGFEFHHMINFNFSDNLSGVEDFYFGHRYTQGGSPNLNGTAWKGYVHYGVEHNFNYNTYKKEGYVFYIRVQDVAQNTRCYKCSTSWNKNAGPKPTCTYYDCLYSTDPWVNIDYPSG